MQHPEIIIAIARASNGIIGAAGERPWHIPADLRRFKQLTTDRPMIMGRKTFDSLPALLEGRRHIVLTRDTAWAEEGAEVAHSVADALRMANAPHVMVIGGPEIYRLSLGLADRSQRTEVALEPDGDKRIDAPDPADWEVAAREDHPADDKGRPAFAFVTFLRRAQ